MLTETESLYKECASLNLVGKP